MMDMEKLASIFEAVKVMPLRPQDFIVLKTNVRLDPLQAAEIHAYIEEVAGHSRILVLDGGSDVEVLRFEDGPAAEPPPVVEPQPVHRPLATAQPASHPAHRPIAPAVASGG